MKMGFVNGIVLSNVVETLAKELKKNYKLSDYEALTVALKAEHNEVLKRAFVVSDRDDVPTALEAIAVALGHK